MTAEGEAFAASGRGDARAAPPHGRLLVISGPSGSGKTSIIERLREHPRVQVSVSVTTRPPRGDERDGVHYTFVSRERFLELDAAGAFVETNDVFQNDNLYGSLRSELEEALATPGLVYVMEVDVIGARNIRKSGFDGTYVFIAPPDRATLESRLRRRGTDDDAAIEKRLGRAALEEELAREDGAVVVVNDDVERSARAILSIMGIDEGTAGRPGRPDDTTSQQD